MNILLVKVCGTVVAKAFNALLVLGMIVVLGVGCQSSTTAGDEHPEYMAPPERVYRLGPGDKVRVIVFGQQDLSGSFEVDSVGRMALPLIRGVEAEGLTIPELEQTITRRLKEHFFSDPRVSIELVKTRPFCVLGEVRNPGCFSYAYGMRAAMAIAVAGGYTYRAKENEFLVTRSDGKQFQGSHETPILPGDVIEVAERFF